MARSTSYKLSAIIGMVDRLSSPARRMAGSAAASFGRIGKGVGGAIRMVSHLTTAISGIQSAVSSATSVVTDYIDATDQLAKEARSLNLTTEALSELRHAADRSGVSAEEFAAGLRTMNKAVAEAKIGKGTLFTLLKKVSPEMLRAVGAANTTEEAFNLLAGAAAAIEGPLDRSLLLTNAFGRSGTKLASMVSGGTEALEEMREEARNLGLSISTKAGIAAEDFKDDMTRLEGSIRGTKAAIAGALIPVLAPLLKEWTAWLMANRELVSQTVVEWFEKVAAFVKDKFTPAMEKLGEILDWVTEHWKEIGVAIGLINLAPLTAALGPLGVALAAATAGWASFYLEMQTAKNLMDDILGSQSTSAQISETTSRASYDMRKSVAGDPAFARFVDERLSSGPDAQRVNKKLAKRASAEVDDSLTWLASDAARSREMRKEQLRFARMPPIARAAAAGELDRLIGDFRAQQAASKAELTVNFVGLPETARVMRPKTDGGIQVTTKTQRNTGRSTLLEAPL